jgi:hypothetical protein
VNMRRWLNRLLCAVEDWWFRYPTIPVNCPSCGARQEPEPRGWPFPEGEHGMRCHLQCNACGSGIVVQTWSPDSDIYRVMSLTSWERGEAR